ncbi:hypothetical protein GUITHDRAFT_120391 [Guillardia theta CCMP2712]|uniref:Amine oxidase domain-containing protein n=1 Tax=Guillardia theta (strain CCMP2712) TaxID=905079 RepID=L1IBE2_GUITC|nr:hypothetical protein GUITHDRAFT_120391 [Guillardia theta CCMP2712]EKX33387.1 hypothetical protein GUITHDRAFT_120391 [Guillardia theta CCMP2712]|eukprot:XP_005820367.1 hypothetical protein GUITHDRAFT_120391 [Guillardia theta CCMP2712]
MGSDVEAGGRDARPHAVVVGAGFGGMSAAARLACCGYNVTCVEKHATPGGRCTEIVREGHRFDVGPSIILVPSAYFEAFASIGDDLNNHVELMRVDPTYTIRFYDGTKLELTGDLQRMETQLESMETGSFKRWGEETCADISYGHDNLHMTLENIAHRNFYSLFEFFSPLNAFLLHKLKVLRKHYNYISQVFKDSRLRSAFSFQDMYIGVSPYDAPATFSLLQYTEFCDGVWYCRGGLYKISQALAKVLQSRVTCVWKLNMS